jgi:phage gp36-like protein
MPTPYVTVEVLRATFGASDIDKPLAATDIDVAQLLANVNAEVDGYVSGAVTLPPTDAAIAMVRGAAADIARYRLYRRAADEDIRKRFDDAIAFLTRIATRKVPLPAAPPEPGEPAAPSGIVADCGAAPRRLQRDQLAGW